MSAHTLGPWRFNADNRTVDGGDPGPLTAFRICTVHGWEDDYEANARLIAAAPDLLDACQRLLRFNEDLCADVGVSTHYPSADAARAAIAKATGEAAS